MKIELAKNNFTEPVIRFFDKHLDKNNSAIISREFFYPLGIKAAIGRNQIIYCLENDKIIAALRFYPRKKDNIVSVYQYLPLLKNFAGKNYCYKY